jgi:hypothetical protein
MKKLLICGALVLSVCTPAFAVQQINYRSDTGAVQVVDQKGRGLIYDPTTGAYKVSGTIKGVGISLSDPGTGAAKSSVGGDGLLGLLALAQKIVTRLVPFLVGLALLAFFWFLIEYIVKGSQDPKKHEEGLRGMGYSLLALFVMLSVWGILTFVGSIIGIGQGGDAPKLNMPR